MTDKTTRRAILKMVASFPLALTFGLLPGFLKQGMKGATADEASAAETKQSLAESSSKLRILNQPEVVSGPLAKFHQSRFEQSWDFAEFTSADNGDGLTRRGIVIRLPDGELVAYESGCQSPACSLALKEAPNAVSSKAPLVVACGCRDNLFNPSDGISLSELQKEPLVRLRVRRCHERVCVLS